MEPRIKCLNLGSGFQKSASRDNIEWVNVDKNPECKPDFIIDIEDGLSIFHTESFDYVYAKHLLEHIRNFDRLMKEVHRVLKPLGKFAIEVPYYTSVGAFQDPTHVRFFTENTFKYFDEWKYLYSYPHFRTLNLEVVEGNDGKYMKILLEAVK